jgi:hypothetical protein
MVKSKFDIFQFIRLWKHKKDGVVMIGRWNLDYDNTIQNIKVYLANMDHCGCCDSYTTNFETTGIEKHKLKIKVQESKKNIIDCNRSYEYLLPYVI